MSFVITVYVPEAIVMASDSRQSITITGQTPDGTKMPPVETVASDSTYKTFLLRKQRVGISAYGNSLLGKVQMESHIKRLEEEKLNDGDSVDKVADKLIAYCQERFPGADTAFHIAGFKKEKGISIPYVYTCHIGRKEMNRVNFNSSANQVIYGCSWGGQSDVISTILKPYQIWGPKNKPISAPRFPIIYDSMNVQDAIDFAVYAVRITIDTMRFQARVKNVGGSIDVLLLTPEEEKWVQRKELHISTSA
ncbi:MAG: hypothetical protein U9R04_04955 [Chloroflexota bacterium]|nr:hypothetical protein [Chloroflexota bacterium]